MSTQKWSIDASHSEVHFKVKHLMISTVTGHFGSFEGSMENDNADLSDAKISFSADINSIDTGNEHRDGHLKSNDFFNAEQFPKLSFVSTSFTKLSDDKFEMKGDFTLRDVTKPVTLHVEYNGQMNDPYGNTKAGFEINGVLLRKDFGLTWDAATEAGTVVVSNEVKLHLNIQMILAK